MSWELINAPPRVQYAPLPLIFFSPAALFIVYICLTWPREENEQQYGLNRDSAWMTGVCVNKNEVRAATTCQKEVNLASDCLFCIFITFFWQDRQRASGNGERVGATSSEGPQVGVKSARTQQPHRTCTPPLPFVLFALFMYLFIRQTGEREDRNKIWEREWLAVKGHRLESNLGCCCGGHSSRQISMPLFPFFLFALFIHLFFRKTA